MRLSTFAALAFALGLTMHSRSADACSLFNNGVHAADPSFASDHVAPGPVDVIAKVTENPDRSQCSYASSISLKVAATDDMAPHNRLGYQLRIVEGDAPSGWNVGADPLTVGLAEELVFYSADEDMKFTLEVRAVDLNQNVGPPTLVEVEHSEGGCSTSTPDFALVTVLAPLLIVCRRRRSRT
jgi:hypothetical protein